MSRYIVQAWMRPPQNRETPYAVRTPDWQNVSEADDFQSAAERFFARKNRGYASRVVDTETGEVIYDVTFHI